jgi:hypothetical protein
VQLLSSYLTGTDRRESRPLSKRSDKMRDAMEARFWAGHGHAFSTAVAGIFAAGWTALKRLNAIQFDAPWDRDGGARCG